MLDGSVAGVKSEHHKLNVALSLAGTPSDAVNLVLYLLEGTDFTTGNVYRIDGGRFLGTEP